MRALWRSRYFTAAALIALALAAVTPRTAASQVVPSYPRGSLAELAREDERLRLRPALEEIESARSQLLPAVDAAWAAFRQQHGMWAAYVDARSGRIEAAEGAGIAWIPGTGNRLAPDPENPVDLATLEGIARSFVTTQSALLGLDERDLVLSAGRSGEVADYLWFVDFDVTRAGVPLAGARVVFRVNHGNLVQLGLENVPPSDVALPAVVVGKEEAQQIVAAEIGGFQSGDTILDQGSLRFLPANENDDRFVEGFAFGRGYGIAAVWEVTFRRAGEPGTWRARVDASSGELLELFDLDDYAQAKGGVITGHPAAPDVMRAMPSIELSNATVTNPNGRFPSPTSPLTGSLFGPFVRIQDDCGAISASTDASGDLPFGSSMSGTNCATPGVGGPGNTRSARTGYYWLNRGKEFAKGWLPMMAWLSQPLEGFFDGPPQCNAFWSNLSGTVNFFRSAGDCRNSGEVPGVILHELGHGIDTKDGNGRAPEQGTRESNGDITAALALHSSCPANGFHGGLCDGYGNPCTSCTGSRDIDWARKAAETPSTVANFTQPFCEAAGSRGPCGREGHCESLIPSEAVWDFVNRDLPEPGGSAAWNLMERVWFLSRPTATQSFTCNRGQVFTSNGCNIGSLWKVLRVADDDDGDLANGTPHGGALFAAFNRHGIACTTDPAANVTFAACTPPPTPLITTSHDVEQVRVVWENPTSGHVFDLYRNDSGCDAGFTRISKNHHSTAKDLTVVDGDAYFYQIVAHPSGDTACASPPSHCQRVVPGPPILPACNSPAAPVVTATAINPTRIDLSWDPVPGATLYRVFTAQFPEGPFSEHGTTTGTTYSNTGIGCGRAHSYVVRAEKAPTCVSANSAPATATTLPCPPCQRTILYSNDFETGTGLADWVRGSFLPDGATKIWRGIQACPAASGDNIFRFGGLGCSDDYAPEQYAYAQPQGSGGIAIPHGSTGLRLSFTHRRAFGSGGSGGTLAVSFDGGSSYAPVPASAITSGGYDGVVASSCAPEGALDTPIWTGSAADFITTTVDLDQTCPPRGCGAHGLGIAFTAITDCGTTDDGWFLDDVTVTACVPQ